MLLANETESQQYCTEHTQHKLESYCPVHDCIYCQIYPDDRHKSCAVKNIDDACKNIGKPILEEHRTEISKMNKTFLELEDETKIYTSDVNTKSQNIESKIVQAKATAINQINETATKMVSEIQEENRKTMVEEYELTAKCKTISEKLALKLKVIEFIEEHGTENQAFILAHHMIPTVNDIGDSVSTIISSTSRIKLAFNEQHNVISYILKLGSIIKSEHPSQVKYTRIKEKHAQCVVPCTDKPPTSFKLTSIFKTSYPVNISGMIVTEDNKLLLCDNNKHEVLVYNYDGQYVSTITMEHQPWDIAVIPSGDQYVVTLPWIRSIQFINSKDLTPERCVKLPTSYYVHGIAADNQYIYVGEHGKILVLNHEGSIVREIKLEYFDVLYYLAVSDNNLYASDSYGNIYGIVVDVAIWKTTITGAKFIQKIIVDRHGYIYVGDGESGKVYRLYKELKQTMTIGDDNVRKITAICFNKHCTTFFVACDQGIAVYICS